MTFLIGGCAKAAGKPFVASEEICKRPSRAELDWLDVSVWVPFTEYIRVCKIQNGKAPPALLLISVWADLYYTDKPAGTETITMPKPLLFMPNGYKVGELPVNFPSDPPSELVIRFTNWQRGLPNEIRLCVSAPTASGDQTLQPLKYIPANQHYEQVLGATKLSGDCHAR